MLHINSNMTWKLAACTIIDGETVSTVQASQTSYLRVLLFAGAAHYSRSGVCTTPVDIEILGVYVDTPICPQEQTYAT